MLHLSLFQNKYRNGTCRKSGWNYANPGYYFVTICVKNRIPVFGIIKNNQVILSDIGIQADKCGFKIGVTKYTLNNYIDFSWQRLYYDHIIRNEKSLHKIRNYIINNPRHQK